MHELVRTLSERILSGKRIGHEEALMLCDIDNKGLIELLSGASRIREKFFGNRITLCTIINAKSGSCSENCAFCAQSSHNYAEIPEYELADEDQIVEFATRAEKNGSSCYGIVTSGTGITEGEELERICSAVSKIRSSASIHPSCSLGIIDYNTAVRLKIAGMTTYHHNLETARSFFPSICTTHDYEDDIKTIRAAKLAGLKVCSGGIFGLGENSGQRVEMAMTLMELEVDSVPLNFLDPVKGTPLEMADYLTPLECLKIIAIYRFILPDKEIKVCGGREKNLRELQSWIFMAGASGMMTGNYLTKPGRPTELDRQMLSDLQLEVAECNR